MTDKEIALMYSGGLDTTHAALELAKTFKRVHLLTFCNGICLAPKSSGKHVSILRQEFGDDQFIHTIIPIAPIFKLLRKNLLKDICRFRSPLLFDLCCRLSMEVATILYCLDKKISYAADASNPQTQGHMFIQQAQYLHQVDRFFRKYNIEVIRSYPQLACRQEIARQLRATGINTGCNWLKYLGISTQLFTQPFCLWAPVAFLFTSPLRKIPLLKYLGLPLEQAIIFRREKEKLAAQFIDYLRHNHSLADNQPCVRKFARLFQCAPDIDAEKQ